MKFDLLCLLQVISNYAYDIHYSAKGGFFYSDHIFSERLGDRDEFADIQDDLIETLWLGRGEEAPKSAEISAKVAEMTPEVLPETDKNFKTLRELIIGALVMIEQMTGLRMGEQDLIGTIAHILQRHNGLLYRQLTYTPEEIRNSDEAWANLVKPDDTMGTELKENDKGFWQGLKAPLQKLFNDRWITVGARAKTEDDEGRKGRHILLKDGESPKDAMKRQWGVDVTKGKDKSTETEKKTETQDPKTEKKEETRYKTPTAEWAELLDKEKKEGLSDAEKARKKELEEKENLGDGDVPEFIKKQDEVDQKLHDINHKIHEISIKKRDMLVDASNKASQSGVGTYDILKQNPEYDKYVKQYDQLSKERESLEQKKRDIFANEVNKRSETIKGKIATIKSKTESFVNSIPEITTQYDYRKEKAESQRKEIKEMGKRYYEDWYSKGKEKEYREKYNQLAQEVNKYIEEKKSLLDEATKKYIPLINKRDTSFRVEIGSSDFKEVDSALKEALDGFIGENVVPAGSRVSVKKMRAGFRAEHNDGTIKIAKDDSISTFIHEYAHFIEKKNPHILANSLAFAKMRTGEEKTKRLNDLTDSKNYKGEYAKSDKFFHPYCGRVYDIHETKYEKKSYSNSNASEIMSMGLERLFTQPRKFAKEDREYFDFVVANIKGWI